MKKSPDKQIFEDIGIELGVDPSFIEKDWYAVQVIEAISNHTHAVITPVFSGGTSLSKGYGLLQRFSEDLDFRIAFEGISIPARPVRRSFRQGILDATTAIDGLELSEPDIGGNYFKVSINYPQKFDVPDSLRPSLQLEFSYTPIRSTPQKRPVSSFVNEFSEVAPETAILCLNPTETGSDKLSALIWRVIKRDRRSKTDDPAMIRHLHDLCALKAQTGSMETFKAQAQSAFSTDMQTQSRHLDMPMPVAARAALNQLASDQEYRREYENFVTAVSYADEDNRVGFDGALEHLATLVELFN